MRTKPPGPSLDLRDKLALFGFAAASLLVAGAPLVVGVALVSLVPSLGGLRAGIPPVAVTGWVMLAVVLAVVLGSPLDRVARRPFGRHARAGTLAAEAVSLAFLWLLMLPMVASGWAALLAASIGVVLYKSGEPLLNRWDRKQRADGEG